MSEIIACGYVGLASEDFDAWRAFATALGIQISDASGADNLLLRIDERAWRICVERGPIGPSNGVSYVGWEVANESGLDALLRRLSGAGVPWEERPDLAVVRRVRRLIRCVDPGGHALELFVGALVANAPFVSPTGAAFVTRLRSDGDLGFSHMVVGYPDFAAAYEFYVNLLGFRVSDVCVLSHGEWLFLHVNARHHSLAFARSTASVFHHFMLEVESLPMVGRAHDRLRGLGAPFTTTLGQHNNDKMISFYVRTPSGIEVEYGTGGLLVDDDSWTTVAYDGTSDWGHQPIEG